MEDVRSKHFADTANWVQKVIESGTHPLHNIGSRRLLRLWQKMYQDKLPHEVHREISWKLEDILQQFMKNSKN